MDDDARGMLAQGLTGVRHYGEHGERRLDELSVFVQSFAPPPRMLVFGAIDFAAAVARAGKFLGYQVTVCDARPVFATSARFPDADEVVVQWPHRYLASTPVDERTVICVLTHDPKFDVPVLEVALRTPAGYIGAMGSRRTHEDRLARLREAGLDRGGTRPAPVPDRAGPRGPDPGGDRGLGGRRADPAPLGRFRPPPHRHRRAGSTAADRAWPSGGHPAAGRAVGWRTVGNQVAGVLLAAGEGKRLGAPKALVELGGRRLVDRGVDLLRDGGTDPVLVVTGAVPVTVPGVIGVHNPDWRTGMGSSLAAGLRALPGDCTAAVIALVDQPLIGPEVVRRLLAAYPAGRSSRWPPTTAGPATRCCWPGPLGRGARGGRGRRRGAALPAGPSRTW